MGIVNERDPLLFGDVSERCTAFFDSLKEALISPLAAIALISALLMSFVSAAANGIGENEGVVSMVAPLVISIPAVSFLDSALSAASEGMNSGCELFSELIPMVSAVVALGAGGGASAMASSGLSITLSFVSGFVCRGMVGAAELIFAFAMMGPIDSLGLGAGFARGIRNAFVLAAGAVSTIILGSLSVSAAVSVAADSLGLRAARYAASSAIPIVGGTVSGALGALVSGIRSLSVVMGTLGAAALASTFFIPLITLLGYKITLGACSILCVFTGANHGQRLFSSLSLAIDAMMAALALSATLYILELTVLCGILKGGL